MKQLKILWDMPITLEIIDERAGKKAFNSIFDYFKYIDDTFSTFRKNSEISKINLGKIKKNGWSRDIKTIFDLSEKTRKETNGYFNIYRNGKFDPLGIVKGWAINNAAETLKKKGFKNFYINAGGDIQVMGKNKEGNPWKIGVRNPFKRNENVKVLTVSDKGIATSGTYIRGVHIQNPYKPNEKLTDILSLTVIGPNVFEADRFATGAFAMGKDGINFIENLKGFEGYMIDKDGIATYTSNFNKYVFKNS